MSKRDAELNVDLLIGDVMEHVISAAKQNIRSKVKRLEFYQEMLRFLDNTYHWEGQLDCSDIDPVYDDAVCCVHPELAELIEEDRSRRANDEEMAGQAFEEGLDE